MRPYLLIFAVVGALIWSAIPVEAAALHGVFVDDDYSVHEPAIEAVAAEGITVGCNPPTSDQFCPRTVVTRGQMAAFLHRGFSSRTVGAPVEFVDDDSSIFEGDIEWLGSTGITVGCNPPVNDRFCPNDWVTRGQMAAFLVRALELKDRGDKDFTDDNGSVFEADIERLATAGVTLGCNPPTNDRFCPTDPVTREQMASFLARALDLPQLPPVVNLATGWWCAKDGETCSGTASTRGGRTMRVSEGWDQAIPMASGEETGFRASGTRFELLVDGVTQPLAGPVETGTTSVASRTWTTNLTAPTGGSFSLEGRWYWQNTLVRRTRIVVSIG